MLGEDPKPISGVRVLGKSGTSLPDSLSPTALFDPPLSLLDCPDPEIKLYITHPEVQFHPVLLKWYSTSPRRTFSTNLKGQMDKLQLELHQQLQDIQCLTKQEVFQTLRDNLDWLNPKNWFDGLNLRMWVFGATGCLLIIIMFCVVRCICKLFSQGRVRDK